MNSERQMWSEWAPVPLLQRRGCKQPFAFLGCTVVYVTVLQDTCGSQSKPVLPMFSTGSWTMGSGTRTTDSQSSSQFSQHSANDPDVPEEHLQNTDDLVALWSAYFWLAPRQERQQRGTITIGNPVHRAPEPPFARVCLNFYLFDIQGRHRDIRLHSRHS